MDPSKHIISSWHQNANNWIQTIENSELESRLLATNEAVINAVLKYRPSKILDIGCGEGWLSRTLRKEGINVLGTDGVRELVSYARDKDGDFYFHLSYEEIYKGIHHLPSPFEAIVINFALIDKEDTEKLLAYLPELLAEDGLLIIQTLHPYTMAAANDYTSGWKDGSWNGLKREFTAPYQWYFRTFTDWMQLFVNCGFRCIDLVEPQHPTNKTPLSVIFILRTFKS